MRLIYSLVKMKLFIPFLILATVLQMSCKKTDRDFAIKSLDDYSTLRERFFNTSNADAPIKSLAANMKKQDSIFKFLPNFVKKNGIPRWDKVLYKDSQANNSTNQSNSFSSLEGDSEQALFFIPLQSTISTNVIGYITAYKHNDTLYSYRVYNKDSLSTINAGFNYSKDNLLNTQIVIAYFERILNEQNEYIVSKPSAGVIKGANISFSSQPNSNYTSSLDDCTATYTITTTYEWHDYSWGDGEWVEVSTQVSVIINCEESGGSGGNGTGTGYGNPWLYGTGWPWGSGINSDPNWNWWWTSGGGIGGTGSNATVNWISNELGLNWSTSFWLELNPERAAEIADYLSNTTEPRKLEIAKEHIEEMITNPGYLSFVESYASSNPGMWWENDAWLSDPNNFNLDIEFDGTQYDVLNAQEKELIKKYPVQANKIRNNKNIAYQKTAQLFPNDAAVNDKADAYRHAFYMAMNEMDCGKDINTNQGIAIQFGDAHESEVPGVLQLEKTMDLHNNSIGIETVN